VPARTVSVVEQRHRAVRAVIELGQDIDEVAALWGVHPDTVRRWRRRFLSQGLDGLVDRPRTPRASPARIAPELEDAICSMRQEHPHWGPRRIRAELLRAGQAAPARSTVGQVLRRNGLVIPAARRPRQEPTRFVATAPNELWQLDAFEVALTDGSTVEVIDLLDDHARVWLGFAVVPTVTGAGVWAAFEAAAARWGLPQRVLTDNADYFTGRLRGVVADFERRLWGLGIATSNGAVAHPQTQGKIERLRRTARAWLARQGPIEDAEQLAALLSAFAQHYNFDRPHQGLNDQVPADVYAATAPAGPDPLHPPSRRTLRRVSRSGVISYGGWIVNVGSEWAGWDLEVIDQVDKVRLVFGTELITSFSAEEPKGYLGSGRGRGGTRRPRRGTG